MAGSVKHLYQSFHPTHYILDLVPNREKKTFKGTITIDGHKVGRPSKRLVFHQSGLKITSASVTYHDKKAEKEVSVDRINHHKKFEEVRLHSLKNLIAGSYTIQMTFEGKITNVMSGVYPCFFKYKGKEEKLIATQFESHHAREVFPCIDEPAAKATFDLILTTPKNETVLANTPIDKQTIKEDSVISAFKTTPKMSTYLLAFVYGKLDYKQSKTKSGVVVRAYATPDNVAFTEFAVDVASKCLDFYNDYFGIDYPLAKCDLIALPDFSAGAMENWGCITFREQALLVDPENSSLANKQYVALVIAHELAHQWFGNLVTMRWWTDLWLNEGFASWMEYLAVDHIFPEWQQWIQFAIEERSQALSLDELEHTHPVEAVVKHPDEIRTIFDAISYSKGASLLNMLHNFVGARDFRNGLRYYLEKHSYANTDTTDLWQAIEEVSAKPVKDFMHTWTTAAGYPILKVSVEEKSTTITQERFLINPKSKVKSDVVWPVPLLPNNKDLPALFKASEKVFTTKNTAALRVNDGQSGFYRTTYNASHLEKLGEQVMRGHLSPLERLGLLSDVAEAAKAGRFNSVEVLHFLDFYHAEDNYAVWDVISSILGQIRLVMDDEELREEMKPYIRKLVAEQLKRLGIDRKPDDSHFDKLLRPIVLSMAAGADEPSIVKYCQEVFAKLSAAKQLDADLRSVPKISSIKRGLIDPDLRGTVFGTIARLGGETEFNKLLKLHNQSTMSEERNALVASLTAFRQPELVQRALSLIKSEDVRLQDVIYWIVFSFMNRYAKHLSWDWLKANWDWLEENLGSDLAFYRIPVYAARAFSDEAFITQYKNFFKPLLRPAIERSYHQGMEILEYQTAWRTRSLPDIRNYFTSSFSS